MSDKALDWRTIQQAARTEALEAEGKPLGAGQSVAWAQRQFGRTSGFTIVHRADACEPSNADTQQTLCGEPIPPAVIRVALTPNLIRTLGRCKWCDAEYLKLAERGGAAA